MTTELRRFHVGDVVRVDSAGSQHTVWTVDGDDTDQTPVHDPEPAYRLVRQKIGGTAYRYCYETELVLARPADTASLAED